MEEKIAELEQKVRERDAIIESKGELQRKAA